MKTLWIYLTLVLFLVSPLSLSAQIDDSDEDVDEGEVYCVLYNGMARLHGIRVKNPENGRKCFGANCTFLPAILELRTIATDPENDVLVYSYEPTGGVIVGKGKEVKWDLSKVPPGKYELTYAVDDGIGILPVTKEKFEVEIVESNPEGLHSGKQVLTVEPTSKKIDQRAKAANWKEPERINSRSDEEDEEDEDDDSDYTPEPISVSAIELRNTKSIQLCNKANCSFEAQLVDISISAKRSGFGLMPLIFDLRIDASVSGGTIVGINDEFQWDLSRVSSGTYSLTITFSDPYDLRPPLTKVITVTITESIGKRQDKIQRG